MKAVSCVSILLLLFMLPAVFAQTTDSNLVGKVLDASGGVIQNATVEIQNDATGVKFSTVSGTEGQYRFLNVPVGTYTLTARAPGFSTLSMKNVMLQMNRNSTANLKLEIGQVSTTVEVSTAAVVLDTSTPQLQMTYESKQVVDLPIIENASSGAFYGALNLSLLSAGVASNGGVGQGTGPSVGGQRPMNNNFTVEGVDNNNKGVTGPLVYVPTEATEEFTLLTNQYTAEFGHSTGGQFNTIVRSGTNSVHGSLYEYMQNRDLNAVDQAWARQGITSNPRFDQNKVGASIGGPIVKDKLFYFGNFEYAPLGEAYTLGTPVLSPTAAGYALLDAMSTAGTISQNNYNVFKQYVPPAPTASQTTTVNGVNIPIGILPINGASFTNFYTAVGSINYNMSNTDQLRGRYIYNRTDELDDNANLPTFWTNLPNRYTLVTIGQYHTFGPKLTNEFRIGYNRYTNNYIVGNQKFAGLDQFPNITIDSDLGLQVGPDPNAPQYSIQNTYQITENLNWMVGGHNLKFGVDVRNSISPQFFIQRSRGDYDYYDLQEYLTDQVPSDLAERNLGSTIYYGNQWATYFYATDTFNITKKLTAYMGLRYERTTVPESMELQSLNEIASVPGLIDFHAPKTSNKNFAPRIGLAYTPGKSSDTVIRAGFGMGYDVVFDNIGLTAYPPQLSSTFDASLNPTLWHAPFLANGGIAPGSVAIGANLDQADARNDTSSYIPDQRLPYSLQWNLGVSHVFKNDYTVEIRYVGTKGVHLLTQDQINNINPPVTATRNLPTYLSMPTQQQLDALPYSLDNPVNGLETLDSIGPVWAANGFDNTLVTAWTPRGNSFYNGMALQFTRRFSKGLSTVASYTWSHNIDDSTATHYTTVLSPRRVQDFADRSAEKASSALDRRQRLSVNLNWDSPWFNGSPNWFMKNVAGNWRFVGTYTAETGELATAVSGIDSNLNYDSAGDRTVINAQGNPHLGSDITPLYNTAGYTVAYLATNPNAMYIKAGYGAYANGGRDTLQMPGINNFDISITKKFTITESKGVEFRADLNNAFNHPQYTAGLISSVGLTSQTSNRTFLEPSSPAFQQWNENFPSNPRVMQLALRLLF
jgi:hypothetical protein